MIIILELLTSISIPLLLGLVFVAPLVFQFSETGFQFLTYWQFLSTEPGVVQAVMFICVLNVIAGVISFPGWRLFAWTALFLMFSLSILHSEQCRLEWEIWRDKSTVLLYRNYFLELAFLILIPVQIHLWRIGVPVIRWARGALIAATVIQASAVLLQFITLKTVGIKILAPFDLVPQNWIFARDSTQVYTEALRLPGFFRNPNSASMLLTLTWPALLISGRTDQKRAWLKLLNFLRYAMVMGSCLAILLTYSRAGYIGLTLQILCILGFYLRKKHFQARRTVIGGIVLMTAFLAGLTLIPGSSSRIAAMVDMRDGSLLNRLSVYSTAAQLLLERPLSGWGPAFFNTLYNRYYKLPYEKYAFFDVHSGILSAVLEIGIVGAVVFVLFLVGTSPARTLRRIPQFAWLGPVGCFVPLFSDNPSAHPAVLIPLLWVAGVWLCVSIGKSQEVFSGSGKHQMLENRGYGVVCVLLVLWAIGYLQPIMSPEARFEESIRRVWRGPSGQLTYYLKDLVTNRLWADGPNEARVGASVAKLAIARTLVDSESTSGTTAETTIPLTQAYAPGSGVLTVLPSQTQSVSVGDALYLMLCYSDNSASNGLLDFVGTDAITTTSMRVTGRDTNFISGFGRKEVMTGRESPKTPPKTSIYSGATMTARQAATTMVDLVETSTTLSEIAEAALERNMNRWGLARYFESYGPTFHKSGTTNKIRNDVLLYRNGPEYWVLAVMREDSVPRVGIDQFSYRALGEMAWKVHLYLQKDSKDY